MTTIDVEAVEEIDDGSDRSEEGSTIEAPEYVLYGGKGGVGKTTMAAATALKSARDGTRTLVVSTDPAHSLSDVLDREVPAEPARIHAECPLFGVEIDPDDADLGDPLGAGSFPGGFGFFGGGMMGTGSGGGPIGGDIGSESSGSREGGGSEGSDERGASMPGADEAAALRLLLRYLDDDRFERVVVDTAPTGHTLRLFELPERLDATLDRMGSLREGFEGMFSGFAEDASDADSAGPGGFPGFFGSGDVSGASDSPGFPGFGGAGSASGDESEESEGRPFGGEESGLDDLRELSGKLEALGAALSDPDRTDFRIVVVPERTSVVESRRLLDSLAAFDVPVGTIVVNRVMEDLTTVLGAESEPGTEPTAGGDEGDRRESEHDHGESEDGFVAPQPDSCEFCRARLDSQMDALGEADDLFRGRTVERVPLFAREARGEEFLRVVAACLA
jgi:arsenite-transporting ATPase